jgi:hypothetical protein
VKGGRLNGRWHPLGERLTQDSASASLENSHQIDAFNEFLVLLSLIVGELPLVGFRREFIKAGLRLRVELKAHNPLGDFWGQTCGQRAQKSIKYCRIHAFFVPREAREK